MGRVVEIEKEWAAVHGDRILFTRDTRREVENEIDRQGINRRVTEVVAFPKNVTGGPF